MHRLSAVAPRPKFEHSVFGIFKDDLPQPDLTEERSGEKQWKEEIKNRSGLWHKNGKLLKPLKLDKIDISSSSRLNTSLPDTVGCSHRPQIPSGALTDRTGMGQRATVAFEKVRSLAVEENCRRGWCSGLGGLPSLVMPRKSEMENVRDIVEGERPALPLTARALGQRTVRHLEPGCNAESTLLSSRKRHEYSRRLKRIFN